MGVPSFYRWILYKFRCNEYPIVLTAPEEMPHPQSDRTLAPPLLSGPNPIGIEFDNLYVDMNGIIHPCFHPQEGAPPESEEEVFAAVCGYVDRLVAVTRPRRLIYLAIDGVAPRAKMNQQRERRYTAAQESLAKRAEAGPARQAHLESLCQEYVERHLAGTDDSHSIADSNVITPGTPFMARLSARLRAFVSYRISTDPLWSRLAVVLSDASVPGEGEHKMMSYIRQMRQTPDWDPNQSHVIYGLDADLIMLALASHEPRFYVLREAVFIPRDEQLCRTCGTLGHSPENCPHATAFAGQELVSRRVAMQLTDVFGFRETLRKTFREKITDFDRRFDFERVIDDFVFLCFLCGNDFLPHIPSVDIRENSIEEMMSIYANVLGSKDGQHITEGGVINFGMLGRIAESLGSHEYTNIRKRIDETDKSNARFWREAAQQKLKTEALAAGDSSYISDLDVRRTTEMLRRDVETANLRAQDIRLQLVHEVAVAPVVDLGPATPTCTDDAAREAGFTDAAAHAARTQAVAALQKALQSGIPVGDECKPMWHAFNIESEIDRRDHVRLTATGRISPDARRNFYCYNFGHYTPGVPSKLPATLDEHLVQQAVLEYCRGLQWTYAYYMLGCMDWSWYYPYHYAPLASDIARYASMAMQPRLDNARINGSKSVIELISSAYDFDTQAKPVSVFEQLMTVLPPISALAVLPPSCILQMIFPGGLADATPTKFVKDMANTPEYQPYRALPILPFVPGAVLRSASAVAAAAYTAEELTANQHTDELLYLRQRDAFPPPPPAPAPGTSVDDPVSVVYRAYECVASTVRAIHRRDLLLQRMPGKTIAAPSPLGNLTVAPAAVQVPERLATEDGRTPEYNPSPTAPAELACIAQVQAMTPPPLSPQAQVTGCNLRPGVAKPSRELIDIKNKLHYTIKQATRGPYQNRGPRAGGARSGPPAPRRDEPRPTLDSFRAK